MRQPNVSRLKSSGARGERFGKWKHLGIRINLLKPVLEFSLRCLRVDAVVQYNFGPEPFVARCNSNQHFMPAREVRRDIHTAVEQFAKGGVAQDGARRATVLH